MPASSLTQLQALLLRRQPESRLATDGDWGPETDKAFARLIAAEGGPFVTRPLPAPAPAPAPAPPVPVGLPTQYAWLRGLGAGLPLIIEKALELYGTHEGVGDLNSAVVMGWAAEVGLKAAYTADSIPWCGLFAAVVVTRAGKTPPKDPLWALNWAYFGVDQGQPGLGDVLTFTRAGGGHVGFYVGEDSTAYHVLGGNTSDQVMIARIEKTRLYHARRPAYAVQPAAVKPYILASTGAMSTNEA